MGRLPQVLGAFLKLGLTSFGGPIAHIGYFRDEFVLRRRWLDEHAFADLVGLCQILPGPSSSQLAFALGLRRAGYAGAVLAWASFALPSVILLVAFAYVAPVLGRGVGPSLVHGLKLCAVAIVAQAVYSMARTWWRNDPPPRSNSDDVAVSRCAGIAASVAFIALLCGLPWVAAQGHFPSLNLFNAIYRCGALVFGGGHVVLPLLHQAVVTPGWVGNDAFLAGYGAAQAIPGPLFAFAAYLGAIANIGPGGLAGAALCTLAIFLPGMLVLVAALRFWVSVRHTASAQISLRIVNLAVLGLLAVALVNPIWTSSVNSRSDVAIALGGFALLMLTRLPPVLVVALTATLSIVLQLT
jgi:chromate transporter